MTSAAELFPVLAALGFDVNRGIELCGGDEAFYCDLIQELYADPLTRRTASLRNPDLSVRREYAHLMKGTLQVLGDTRASQTARELEQALREGTPHESLTLEFAAGLDRMSAALETVFGKLPA